MTVKDTFLNKEGYTHNNWVYKNVNVSFSRLYYIVDGEAYYEENGSAVRLKKGYLYLTPVKTPFTLYENPLDKLLHTYVHVYTVPAVSRFTEIEVKEDTPLYDAVSVWRKYSDTDDRELLISILQLVMSCIDRQLGQGSRVTDEIKRYLDGLDSTAVDMKVLSRTLGYSREYLTREFVKVYRITPMQYLSSRKMEQARRALLSGASIKEIAETIGYSSPYAFSKAFKNYFGLSPTIYVKTAR